MQEKSMSIYIESLNIFKSNKKMKNIIGGESFTKQKVNESIHYYYHTDPIKLSMVFQRNKGKAQKILIIYIPQVSVKDLE